MQFAPDAHLAHRKSALAALVSVALLATGAVAQNLTAVLVEAESGDLGAALETIISWHGAEAVTTTINSAGDRPGGPELVASLSVSLPDAGVYEVYARV